MPVSFDAHAAVLVSEQFSYGGSSGTLAGNDGGHGWDGAWSGGNTLYQTGSLTHPDLTVAGGRAQTISDQSTFRDIDTASIAPSLLDGGKLGVNGSTLWLRMNLRMEGTNFDRTTAPGWGGLSLFDGGSERLFMGKRNNSTRWGVERSGQGPTGNLSMTQPAQAWIDLNIMMIVRVDYSAGSESLSAWWLTNSVPLDINGFPDESQLPTANTMTINDMRFDRVRISSGNDAELSMDEFFMATDFNDLFPGVVPEPGTMSLLLAGVVVLRRLRLKKLV